MRIERLLKRTEKIVTKLGGLPKTCPDCCDYDRLKRPNFSVALQWEKKTLIKLLCSLEQGRRSCESCGKSQFSAQQERRFYALWDRIDSRSKLTQQVEDEQGQRIIKWLGRRRQSADTFVKPPVDQWKLEELLFKEWDWSSRYPQLNNHFTPKVEKLIATLPSEDVADAFYWTGLDQADREAKMRGNESI